MRLALPLLLVALLLFQASAPASAAGPSVYFPETGHTVAGQFLWAYQRLGGLERFGYPRTEALTENGRTVQYFQRAVLEAFPEHAGTPYETQLRLLGDLLTQDERGRPEWLALDPPIPPGTRYFAETRHGVSGPFLAYFERAGGLESLGYPISEPFERDGLLVQYFQRARLELHPSNPPAYQVELGLLGDELIGRAWPAGDARLARVAPPEQVGTGAEARWSTGRIDLTSSSGPGRYNAAIAVRRLDGATLSPGQRLSFDDVARSWDGREDEAYLVSRGTSCTGGLVTMRGGGVCYVSTALWRAWMEAGLKTVQRVSHSGLLDDFGAGYDAANTLVVENDSPANLRLVVRLEGDVITVDVMGDRPPDRRAAIRGPVKQSEGRYVVYQDVEWLDGRRSSAAFQSLYCW